MASYQFVNRPNQVRQRDSFSSEVRHGRSKAQMCLRKILDFISSHQTLKESSFNPQISKLVPESDENSNKPLFFGNRGLDIDLNLDFCSPPHTADSGGGGVDSANVSMAEKSSVGECDLKEEVNGCDSSANKDDEEEEEEEESVVEERGTEFSEVINTRSQSSEIDNNGVAEDTTTIEPNNNNPLPELRSDHDFLHLLIEAAKLISGDFADAETEKPSQIEAELGESEAATAAAVEFYGGVEDISPVVRSKRGRSQVLPYRYRDSILEPLTRFSAQRSTSSSTKRRSR
ncbi:hypothetical protein CsSME_00046639 [Camellia sinensis var. sinensis]